GRDVAGVEAGALPLYPPAVRQDGVVETQEDGLALREGNVSPGALCLTGGVHGTVDVLLIAGTDPAEVLRGEGNLDLDRLLGLGAIGGQLVGGQPAQRLLGVWRECADGPSVRESQTGHWWKHTFIEESLR